MVGYEGKYQVSDQGRVKSMPILNDPANYRPYEKIMTPVMDLTGYYRVHLRRNGESHRHSVHKLVIVAFKPVPEHLRSLIGTRRLQINHINEDKSDNRLCNLEWCDAKYNSNYGTAQERKQLSHKAKNTLHSRATVAQYNTEGNLIKVWESMCEVARQTGFSVGNISSCCRGVYKQAYGYIWRYLDDYRIKKYQNQTTSA